MIIPLMLPMIGTAEKALWPPFSKMKVQISWEFKRVCIIKCYTLTLNLTAPIDSLVWDEILETNAENIALYFTIFTNIHL